MRMKTTIIKNTLLAIILIATYSISLAQDDGNSVNNDTGSSGSSGSSGGFGVGAKTTVQSSWYQDGKIGLGYAAGAFATYMPLDFLTIQVEVLYSSTAGRLDDYMTTVSLFDSTEYTKRTLRFYTIEVPVIARYQLPFEIFGMSTNAYLGASYGYNLGVQEVEDKTHYYTQNGVQQSHTFKNSKNYVNSSYAQINWEGIIGVGVNLDLFGFPSHIDLRYKQGFNNLSRLNTIPIEGGTTNFNSRVISINLGVSLYQF